MKNIDNLLKQYEETHKEVLEKIEELKKLPNGTNSHLIKIEQFKLFEVTPVVDAFTKIRMSVLTKLNKILQENNENDSFRSDYEEKLKEISSVESPAALISKVLISKGFSERKKDRRLGFDPMNYGRRTETRGGSSDGYNISGLR